MGRNPVTSTTLSACLLGRLYIGYGYHYTGVARLGDALVMHFRTVQLPFQVSQPRKHNVFLLGRASHFWGNVRFANVIRAC